MTVKEIEHLVWNKKLIWKILKLKPPEYIIQKLKLKICHRPGANIHHLNMERDFEFVQMLRENMMFCSRPLKKNKIIKESVPNKKIKFFKFIFLGALPPKKHSLVQHTKELGHNQFG